MSNHTYQIANKISTLLKAGKSLKRQELGFTLIELIIVFTIFTILSGVGVASFVNYSRSQAVLSSKEELKSTLYTARSRALSQLKDSSCGSGITSLQLLGYQVVLCSVSGHSHPGNIGCNYPTTNTNAYELQIVCGKSDGSAPVATTVLEKKFVDKNISFDSTSTATYFFFATLTGAVTSDASSTTSTAVVKGYSLSKSVSVTQSGVIQ